MEGISVWAPQNRGTPNHWPLSLQLILLFNKLDGMQTLLFCFWCTLAQGLQISSGSTSTLPNLMNFAYSCWLTISLEPWYNTYWSHWKDSLTSMGLGSGSIKLQCRHLDLGWSWRPASLSQLTRARHGCFIAVYTYPEHHRYIRGGRDCLA